MENAYKIIKQLLYSFSVDVNKINNSLITDLEKEERIKEYLVQYSLKMAEVVYRNEMASQDNGNFIQLDEAVFNSNFLVNSKKVFIPIEKIEGNGSVIINGNVFNVVIVGEDLKPYILTNTKEEIQNKLQQLKQTIKN